ncbi:hypothetical protein V7S43_003134 [Phytophthora oleae]|uniref:Uncharacterized protein n=1 Tax=Phytophthora oleae TaxID=2107226 RepID=A0ABD3FXT4_9STRA
MESDWYHSLPISRVWGKFLNKFPMREDVEAVLAQVAAILQQATDHEEKEEKEEVQKDTDNRCKNPFCGKALPNVYASYCEERKSCQQYRALKFQCLTNANAAAVEDIQANGRRDYFLVLGATRTEGDEKKNAEADEPFVIPRRKCPRTDSTVHNGDQSDGQSSKGELPHLRPRMNVNEVLAHFEPRPAHAPALVVSSQMKAQRVQQASRWTQSRREFHVAPTPCSTQAQLLAGGGRYGRSRNRSMRSGPFTARTPYRPRLTPYRPTPREIANS